MFVEYISLLSFGSGLGNPISLSAILVIGAPKPPIIPELVSLSDDPTFKVSSAATVVCLPDNIVVKSYFDSVEPFFLIVLLDVTPVATLAPPPGKSSFCLF